MHSDTGPRPPQKTPAATALDVANAIGARLHALFRTAARDPLRVLLQAVRSETEARNDRAFAASPVDCRAGCAYCCHQQVTATAPEILLLAERIQEEKPPVRARLRAAVSGSDLEGTTPHTLRRSVGTLVAHEVGLDAARAQLGHSDPSITWQAYVARRTVAPDLREVLGAFFD